jgi:hypothetical protein
MVLLSGPTGWRFLIKKVPLYPQVPIKTGGAACADEVAQMARETSLLTSYSSEPT